MQYKITSNPMMPTMLDITGEGFNAQFVAAIQRLSWVAQVTKLSDSELTVICVHESIDSECVVATIEILLVAPQTRLDFVLPKWAFEPNPMAPQLFELLLWWQGTDKLLSVLKTHPWVQEIRRENRSRYFFTLVNELVPPRLVMAWVASVLKKEILAVFGAAELSYEVNTEQYPAFQVQQNTMAPNFFELSTAFPLEKAGFAKFFPQGFKAQTPYYIIGTASEDTNLEQLRSEIEEELLNQLRARFGEAAENQAFLEDDSTSSSTDPLANFFGGIVGAFSSGVIGALGIGLESFPAGLDAVSDPLAVQATEITTVETTTQTVVSDGELTLESEAVRENAAEATQTSAEASREAEVDQAIQQFDSPI